MSKATGYIVDIKSGKYPSGIHKRMILPAHIDQTALNDYLTQVLGKETKVMMIDSDDLDCYEYNARITIGDITYDCQVDVGEFV